MSELQSSSTIVAIASPAGVGAVSLIRLSGPKSIEIADLATHGKASKAASRVATYCRVIDENNQSIDDGVLTVFRDKKSYTGEESVEFTGHGGMLVTQMVLERLLHCGAVHAGPGEFTQRAFLNGKLDLTQAEGVMDLISAQSRLALRAARGQLEGKLGQRTMQARDMLLETLAHLEAWIDFPEEDIDPSTGQAFLAKIDAVTDIVNSLLTTADQGKALREGVRTVIFGPPNVGKSSLLNHLLGYERAIVSDIAGTTRDTLEEIITLQGIPLRLVDTAGMRESVDTIENQGIIRTNQQIEIADLLLEVADSSIERPKTPSPALPDSVKKVLILNKTDLPEHPSWQGVPATRLSCETGLGFEQLRDDIVNALQFSQADWGDQTIAINVRHKASLEQALLHLQQARAELEQSSQSVEIASLDIRSALNHLGEIPGKVDTEDLLDVIFSSFCIGK